MASAVIQRTGGGTESITVPLRNDRSGLALARDIGAPNAKLPNSGKEDPIPIDHLSRTDVFTGVGRLSGSNAYADAKTLAEDIIKRRPSSSDKIQLDLTALPSGQTHDVMPNGEEAVTLEYVPGKKNEVDVQFSLQVVDSVAGGTQTAQSNLTADAGTGVKLTDGSNPITLTEGLTVTRRVGRGVKLVPKASDDPASFDVRRPATDVFELSSQLSGANAESDAQTLEETLVKGRQGQDALELHFLSNLYSLDAYNVLPAGGQALRTTFSRGQTGVVRVPTLKCRVVDPA